jgi:hypothetical protein
MKVPSLKLTKSGSAGHYTAGCLPEDEHACFDHENNTHSTRTNNDRLPSQQNVQSNGTIRTKSRNLMSSLISPRSYSKVKERETQQRMDATRGQWEQDHEDFYQTAQEPAYDQEQHEPSEACVERRKYRQAAAIDYYKRNGMQGPAVDTPEDLARLAGPKVLRPAGATDDDEAIGDDNEPGLHWVRHEQRRSRAYSTGDKYNVKSPRLHKSKKARKGDEKPMLKYY